MSRAVTAAQIDELLPQTQCGLCSYEGCKPYAQAILHNNETPDRCSPGGKKTLMALGDLLQIDISPYLASIEEKTKAPAVAVIRETDCIGCTKCIQACPVDAIIGSAKQMHTILTNECTGCELCVEPCPVDCIEILPIAQNSYQPSIAKHRFEAKQERALLKKEAKLLNALPPTVKSPDKKAFIAAAVARAKAKRSS